MISLSARSFSQLMPHSPKEKSPSLSHTHRDIYIYTHLFTFSKVDIKSHTHTNKRVIVPLTMSPRKDNFAVNFWGVFFARCKQQSSLCHLSSVLPFRSTQVSHSTVPCSSLENVSSQCPPQVRNEITGDILTISPQKHILVVLCKTQHFDWVSSFVGNLFLFLLSPNSSSLW